MNEIVLLKQESLSQIVQSAPKSYADNRQSHDNCVRAGQKLLDAIKDAGEMNDDLDEKVASFIDKAKRTLKAMNERRAPVTKLFDEVRSAYTAYENNIDPTKKGTITYELQQLRNQYAAKKHKEEEERIAKERERQQREERMRKLRQDIENNLKGQYNKLVNDAIDELKKLDNDITLDNFTEYSIKINNYPTELPAEWFDLLRVDSQYIYFSAGIEKSYFDNIESEEKERLGKQFKEDYAFEVGEAKAFICDRLASKRANLEAMAKANAEEAARIKAQMEERQKAEAERLENERKQREEAERKNAEQEKKKDDIVSLFDNNAALAASTAPKAKITKKINLLNPEGIMPVIALWWSHEGCNMDTEALAKMFKKQIAFCEKLANKEGTFIRNESVEYIDEVKAK